VAVVLGDEELEICLRVLDASDLISIVDEVARQWLAPPIVWKVSFSPQPFEVGREDGVLWKTGIEASKHFDGTLCSRYLVKALRRWMKMSDQR
jgi:hypothetical protein